MAHTLTRENTNKVKALLRYAFEDVPRFAELTHAERRIIGTPATFRRIVAWAQYDEGSFPGSN